MRLAGRRKLVISTLSLMALGLLRIAMVNAERLPVKIYTTADGLGHNIVNRIARDSRGFLWFCTFEGLSRFDGYGFTTYSTEHGLPSQVINDLLETREGDYWVATGAGVCRFNPKATPRRRAADGATQATEAMFTTYSPGEEMKSKEVTSLLQDRAGVIWCGTARGLYRLEPHADEVRFGFVDLGMPAAYAEARNVICMMEDHQGALWVGSESGVYRLLPDGQVEHYTKRQGLPDPVVQCLLEDRRGQVWVGTRSGGLCRMVADPQPTRSAVARVYSMNDGLPSVWLNQLFQASDGSLWAGSPEGLIRFITTGDGTDYHFRVYAQPHGLSSYRVQALAEDRDGNLWLGTANGGAVKFARSGITAFGQADGFKTASAIFKDRAGDLYVVAGPNDNDKEYLINRFDGERFTAIQPQIPRTIFYGWGWNQLVLEDHAGEWWIATGSGLYRFPSVARFDRLAGTPPKAVYTTRDGLASSEILSLFEDTRGDLWVGQANPSGLSRWQRAGETFRHYGQSDGLPSLLDSYPISFAEDRAGGVWIGFSIGGGLVRYRDGRFTRFTSAEGLPEGGIFSLFVDGAGRLWVPTTRGGVCRIDHPEAERPALLTYTTGDGLSSNDVRAITEDGEGRIYLGTGRGIDRLDAASGHLRHYTTNEGALLGDVRAALRDRNGALWFSYLTGLVRLVPEPFVPSAAPTVLITGLRIAGDAQTISALGETEIAPVELVADRNQMQIDFVALGFSPGEGLRYQYRLDGAGQDWSLPSEQRSVNFARLAPGRYRFLVRAINADGTMSEQPASFQFTILSPLWQRWWFLAAAAVLLGLALYWLYRYQLAQRLKVERVRTRIATDLHDDIGANLSLIAMASEVARHRARTDDRQMAEALSLISGTSRELVDSMGDLVWAVNPERDHLVDLLKRMRRFASDVFSARGIAFRFHAPSDDHAIRLSTETRREVLLIFKEAINNIARHSQCASAEVELMAQGGWLTLKLSDNGRGFDTTLSFDGNGLVSMRQRAARLGGTLAVASRRGEGTTLTLKAPLK